MSLVHPRNEQRATSVLMDHEAKKKRNLWLDVRVKRQKPELLITLGTYHTSHGLLIFSLLSHLNHVVLGFSVVFRET